MSIQAQVIVNLFKQLEAAQAAVLKAKGSEAEERSELNLKRVTEALQRTIIRTEV